MRQITDTPLYMKKFLNSYHISSTVLVNECPKCSALLTDVTPDLNSENHSYNLIQITASSLKASFKISQTSEVVLPSLKQNWICTLYSLKFGTF